MNLRRYLFKVALSWLTLGFAQTSFGAISNVVASSDSTNVSYSFSFTGAPQFLRIYLDTDKNAGTGLSIRSIGADYLIENGNFFKYSGQNGAWGFTRISAVTMAKSTASVRWTLSRASLGSPSAIHLIANADNADYSSIISQVFASPTPTPTPTPSATPAVSWTRCASENGTCSFSGTRQIRYGANNVFAYKTATASISCNNATFGDPLVGVVKYCDYSSAVQTSPSPTPSPTPSSTPTPSPTPIREPSSEANVTVNFAASSAFVANPDRGMYHQVGCHTALSQSTLQNYRTSEGISLILCYFNLSSYVTSAIGQSALDIFQNNMNAVRGAGLKVVIRFTYNQSDNGVEPTLSLINTHMDQLKPYFERNADVISTIQVGFIGSWGEWANSQHFGQIQALSSQNLIDRKALTDKLLSVVPVERTVQIRFPRQKISFYGSAPLSSAEAFTGTARARVGHHNDCFLTTSSDWGTYGNTSVEYPYLAEETKYLPMGGETCAYMAPRSDCATALKETAMFHWSYLHQDYNLNVLNAWKTQGCYETIRQKLGYRFQLRSASLPTSAKAGATVAVSLNIENVGLASPFNRRGLELVLRNNSTGAIFKIALKADPRRWLPGSVITVSESLVLPASLPAGTYSLLLNMPDAAASLSGRPEYSIQLANTGVWEPSTGFNKLNANVIINP